MVMLLPCCWSYLKDSLIISIIRTHLATITKFDYKCIKNIITILLRDSNNDVVLKDLFIFIAQILMIGILMDIRRCAHALAYAQ